MLDVSAATLGDELYYPDEKVVELMVGDVFDFKPRFGTDGRTVLWSVRVPEDIDRACRILVQQFPMLYQTNSDLMRQALWYYVWAHQRLAAERSPEIVSLLANAKAAGDAKYTADLRQRVGKFTDNLQDSMLDALCDGNLEECMRQVEQFWSAIKGIPNTWVRNKFIDSTRANRVICSTVSVLKKNGYSLDPDCVLVYT